jgi:hypothetical protein
MTKLFITEFKHMPNEQSINGQPQAVMLGSENGTQAITLGASTQSTAMKYATRLVRLYAVAACHVAIGDNPTATTSSLPLGEGQTEYFGVEPGQKIAVIAG